MRRRRFPERPKPRIHGPVGLTVPRTSGGKRDAALSSYTMFAFSRGLVRARPHGAPNLVARAVCHRSARPLLRNYSMATGTNSSSLPLEGYRVLDMTRVLAGVSPAVPREPRLVHPRS